MEGMDDLDTCTICTKPYDTEIRPRSLPCGHTLCSGCIDLKVELDSIVCPYCHKEHEAFSSRDFSINYTAEALIAKLRETQLGAKTKISSRQSLSLRNRAQAVIDEQMKCLERLLNDWDFIKSDVNNYKSFLDERKSQHEEVIGQINKMLQQHEEMVNLIDKEDKRITDVLSTGEEYQQEARSKLGECENWSETTVERASDELERVFEKLNVCSEKCTRQMPSTDIVKRSEMIISESKAALATVDRATAEAINNVVTLDELQDSDLSIMERVNMIKERNLQTVTEVSRGRVYNRRRVGRRYTRIRNRLGGTSTTDLGVPMNQLDSSNLSP